MTPAPCPRSVLNWKFTNPTPEPVTIAFLASVLNPVGDQTINVDLTEPPQHTNTYRESTNMRGIFFDAPNLRQSNDPNTLSFAITTPAQNVHIQQYGHIGAMLRNTVLDVWQRFAHTGQLQDDRKFLADNPRPAHWPAPSPGMMLVTETLEPGQSCLIPIHLTWHVPFLKAWTENIIVPNLQRATVHRRPGTSQPTWPTISTT